MLESVSNFTHPDLCIIVSMLGVMDLQAPLKILWASFVLFKMCVTIVLAYDYGREGGYMMHWQS